MAAQLWVNFENVFEQMCACDLQNANSFNVLWPDSEGGKEEKSLTKLPLQSSTFFSPLSTLFLPLPHSHADPILSACLFVVRLIL